jgi:hypothetical protein
MFPVQDFADLIFDNNVDFDDLACRLFKYQYQKNALYHAYVDALGISPDTVHKPADIPFLPIEFFKRREVKTGDFSPALIFESSGTTGTVQSRHYLKDPDLYRQSFRRGFAYFYGEISSYVILGLLPSYLERKHSSLVYMVEDWIKQSGMPESGFYLYDHEALHRQLLRLEEAGRKTLLIGVTFALLDFAEKYPMSLSHTTVMETGGMKGRRREWIREELHEFLCGKLGIGVVHAEYGMTELLSQAYSKQAGRFYCPPWMKVWVRQENDPLRIALPTEEGRPAEGIINVIDLANRDSCAFIATEDIGRLYADGSFEVLGRTDHSDLRGCSLLAV